MAKNLSTWCLKRMFILTNGLNFRQPSRSAREWTKPCAFVPKFPPIEKINVDYEEPKDFREFWDDSKSCEKYAVHTLMKILYIDRGSALKTIDTYPAFKSLPKKTICTNYTVLRESGMNKSTIVDNKFLLTDMTQDLKKKIQLIETLDIDINEAAPLFPLDIATLTSFIDRSKIDRTYLPDGHRIQYLADKFNADVSTICRLLVYNSFMLSLPAPKLLSITEYIMEAGMSGKHIMTDLHIYRYQIGMIKEKVELAKKANVKPLKPWIVRCTQHVWERVEQRNDRNELAMNPHPSLQELLCEIFQCSMESVNFLLARDPALTFVNVAKFSENARLIRSEGYSIEDLQRSPRILHRRYETLVEYFNLKKEYGVKCIMLGNFAQPRKTFIEILEKKRSEIDAINTR